MSAPTRTSGASRRSVLRSIGAAGLGVSFGAVLDACSPRAALPPGGEGPKLNFYNRDSFIGPTTLADFQAASGIDVNMSLFGASDEVVTRLLGGNPGFDLIMTSSEAAMRLNQAGMLEKLDHAKIPNFTNLSPDFQDANYDPGRTFTIPYTWQVLGVGYRKSKIDGVPDTWKWLLDSDKYAGRIAVVSGPEDLVRCAAKYLGKSVNAIPDPTLKQIEAVLTKQKPNIKTFHQDNGQDLLLAGDVDIVLEYNSDIARVMREDSDLGFVVPKEGSLLKSACLCIPAGAQRPGNAHKLIDYLLDAKVGADIARTIQYSTPNGAARALMDDKYQNNPVLFPSPAILEKCEYGLYEGETRAGAYADLLERVRAAPDVPPPPKLPPKVDHSKEAYVPPPVVETQGQ